MEGNLNNKTEEVCKTLLEVSQLEKITLPDKETIREHIIYSMRASIKKSTFIPFVERL